jgi:hypothetical protein
VSCDSEPTLGIQYDLGVVERAVTGEGHIDVGHLQRKLYDASGQYRGELSGIGVS